MLTLLLAASACGGGDGEQTIDLGDGNEVSVGGDLPDDFPDDFPIYDGAELEGAITGEQEGIRGTVATWTTGDDFDDVIEFYETEFGNGPWRSSLSGTAGESGYWTLEHDERAEAAYVAVSDGDEVSIVATVGDDPNRADAGDSSGDDADSGDGSGDDAGDGDNADEPVDDGSDDGSDSGSDPSASLPDEVDLPNGFPSDVVPIPDGVRVTSANTITANGVETFTVSFYTKDSIDDVGAFYEDRLVSNGYTQSIETSDANGTYAAYSENTDGSGNIIVISVNDGDVEGYRLAVVQITDA
jgi:hypothetical protein